MDGETLCWSAQSEQGNADYWWYSEFLLNDWGAFTKKEKRGTDAGGLFEAMLNSRQGNEGGAELTVTPFSRSALKWSKLTDVKLYPEYGVIELYGNRSDMIALELTRDMYNSAANFIEEQRELNMTNPAPDEDAAKWVLWAADEGWRRERSRALSDMVADEALLTRRITREALEQTVLECYGDYEQ